LKPIKDYPTLPNFEITQINKLWQTGPMAILDVSEVVIKDWSLVIDIKVPDGPTGQYILTVNEKKEEIPFRFSELDDNREHFVNIVFGDDKKSQVVLTTSFGLRVVYTTKGSGTSIYSDISIDTPRHPELKDNSHGILGRWNGNPDDDAVDANGQKQVLDEKFSWAFGDSWIVPGGRTKTADCIRDEAVKTEDEIRKATDPKVQIAVEKLCLEVLENPELKQCAKNLGRAVPLLKNCITDLIFMDNAEARKQYIEDLVDSFASTCKRRGKGFDKHRFAIIIKGARDSSSSDSSDDDDGKRPHKGKRPHVIVETLKPQAPVIQIVKPQPAPAPVVTVQKCTVSGLVPLYRLYRPSSDDHFYTTSFEEATNAVRKLGYTSEGSPGLVASTAQAGLKPVYRLYKPAARDDHFYTQGEAEAQNANTKLGYQREGIAYYCPPTNYCGATLGFIRYFRGTDHFYTTSIEEGNKNVIPHGGKHEGILCHIWPNNGPVRTPK